MEYCKKSLLRKAPESTRTHTLQRQITACTLHRDISRTSVPLHYTVKPVVRVQATVTSAAISAPSATMAELNAAAPVGSLSALTSAFSDQVVTLRQGAALRCADLVPHAGDLGELEARHWLADIHHRLISKLSSMHNVAQSFTLVCSEIRNLFCAAGSGAGARGQLAADSGSGGARANTVSAGAGCWCLDIRSLAFHATKVSWLVPLMQWLCSCKTPDWQP